MESHNVLDAHWSKRARIRRNVHDKIIIVSHHVALLESHNVLEQESIRIRRNSVLIGV